MTLRLVGPDATATIDAEAGGRLSSLVIAGRERLVTTPMPGVDPPSMGWGCFLMAPWVGRIKDGHVAWERFEADLPRNHGRHAIHGAMFDRPWRVDRRSEETVDLAAEFEPGRWPFRGRMRQSIALRDRSLTLTASIEADEPMPAAIGWHPWFRHEPDESISAQVPAAGVLETSDDLIPTGRVLGLDDRTDLRRLAVIGDRALDHAFVRLERPVAAVRWSDLTLSIAGDDTVTTVVVHSRQGGLCVEPQTAWPDAIRLAGAGFEATGLRVVDPGRAMTASMRLTW
jgi:aldose 1-epimerase